MTLGLRIAAGMLLVLGGVLVWAIWATRADIEQDQPTTPAPWPTVLRTVMPEDLDRW